MLEHDPVDHQLRSWRAANSMPADSHRSSAGGVVRLLSGRWALPREG
jgi:hypothetical protein